MFLVESEGLIESLPMTMGESNGQGRKWEPKTRNSVLSELSFSRFEDIQLRTSLMQASNLVVVKWPDGFESNDMFIYESSA